ncbi:MAG: glycine--tRNA ligase subunit beta [Deltaproteobacteria bacterium]|nr:glycine--tRNA ligase subunit beta [Deltaproteobacteria bacterium]
MPELLFEIGCEELPAGFIDPALAFLERAVDDALTAARLPHGRVLADGTPRRLVVMVDDVAARQSDLEEELQGPPTSVAWSVGADGSRTLTPAGEAFLKKNDLRASDLYETPGKKGTVIAAKRRETGRPAAEVLGALLEGVLPKIPCKKTMSWGDGRATHKQVFARPVQWLLALFGGRALSVRFADVVSGDTTRGHRYHAPAEVRVTSVSQYRAALEQGQVVLDRAERKQLIRELAGKLAKEAGGELLPDEPLLDIVKNLVEKPFPVLGHFEERFLEMPKELLVSEMREHQKYFAVVDGTGTLRPAFVVVAGSESPQKAALAAGNARVLRARFEDGAFYFRTDRESTLASRGPRLKQMVFQRELGTLADKTERLQALSTHLGMRMGLAQATLVGVFRTAALCKCDLVTGVVNEFPELQGVMGRTYARHDGEPAAVAAGIEEHYAPRHAGAALPTGVEGAIVGIADRLDTIVGIIGIGKAPTGSADPFALRRAAIGCAQIMIGHGFRVSLEDAVTFAVSAYRTQKKLEKVDPVALIKQTVEFLRGRVRGVLVERAAAQGLAGAEDIVDAAMAARGGVNDLPDVDARVTALAKLRAEQGASFVSLAATFKRVGNILAQARQKGLAPTELDPSRLVDDAERALYDALAGVEARGMPEGVDLTELRARGAADLARLRPSVDRFFDKVLVMADDPALRDARLGLLARLEEQLVEVADFTKVQLEA